MFSIKHLDIGNANSKITHAHTIDTSRYTISIEILFNFEHNITTSTEPIF